MRENKNGEFRSSVYTQRPPYADFDAPAKFQAIQSIIAKRLKEHPNAMCSYSGGSDSDIMMHMIETVRKIFNLPPVKYYFFETGLEMNATRRHVNGTARDGQRNATPSVCRIWPTRKQNRRNIGREKLNGAATPTLRTRRSGVRA